MFFEGTSYWVTHESPKHLWFIISDPVADDERVVVVNMTSLNHSAPLNDAYNDRSCVIKKGEHVFVQHDTCINYSDGYVTRVGALQAKMNKGDAYCDQRCERASAELLAKMRRGAKLSDHLSLDCIAVLEEQGLI